MITAEVMSDDQNTPCIVAQQQLLGLGLGLSDCDWCTSKFTVSPLSRCLGLGLWLVTALLFNSPSHNPNANWRLCVTLFVAGVHRHPPLSTSVTGYRF